MKIRGLTMGQTVVEFPKNQFIVLRSIAPYPNRLQRLSTSKLRTQKGE